MEKRLIDIAGDTVMEIVLTEPVTIRVSEKGLLRQRENAEAAITKFQARIADINAKLAEIHAEKAKRK